MDTDQIDNLACEIIYTHVNIIAFQTITNHSFWTFHIGGKPVVYIINRVLYNSLYNKHGCLETPDLFLVLNLFNTRNKSGISAIPCIILYLLKNIGRVAVCLKQLSETVSRRLAGRA